MADRRRQIIQLLATRYDGLYQPAGALRTTSGFVPASLELCPHCDGRGKLPDRYGRTQKCPHCAGKGRIAYDPMDANHAPVGSTTTVASARPRKTVRCDACNGEGAHGNGTRCERCDGTGRRDLHAFDLNIDTHDGTAADPIDEAITRRDQAGSYHDLDLALAGIRVHVNKPRMYALLTPNATQALRLLDEVYLPPPDRRLEQLNLWEQHLIDLAIGYIEQRMPDPIRVPAQVTANVRELEQRRTRAKGRAAHPNALRARQTEIRQLHRKGQPVQWIAQEYDLSVATVYEIVNGD